MALRTTYINGGTGDRYAYPYRTTYTKPMPPADYPVKSVGLIDPAQIPPDGTVKVITTQNGNGETIKAAIDANGDVIATKKVPPNIVPIALAAAAAWFFLM